MAVPTTKELFWFNVGGLNQILAGSRNAVLHVHHYLCDSAAPDCRRPLCQGNLRTCGVFWVVCRRFSVRALELVALRDETTPPPELTLSLLTQRRGDEYVLGRLNEEKELFLAS